MHVLDISSISPEECSFVLTEASGVVNSPGWNGEPEVTAETCTWQFEAPEDTVSHGDAYFHNTLHKTRPNGKMFTFYTTYDQWSP